MTQPNAPPTAPLTPAKAKKMALAAIARAKALAKTNQKPTQ